MNKRTCTMPECNKALRARGLCATHYNQTRPDRHKKKSVTCAWCGAVVLTHGGGGRVYGNVCSNQCRQYLATPYCILPANHWARWYGKASAWEPPKAKAQPATFIANTCDECGRNFVEANNYNPSTYCSPTCGRRVGKRTRKAREHGATGNFRWVEVIRLWIAADKRCSYCDTVMTGQPDPDHVIPISRGGRNDIGNIVPCCRICNADKCDMTLDEWKAERERLGKPPRRYSLPFNDERFRHLTLGTANGASWRHSLTA